MKTYIVDEKTLLDLLESSLRLQALEAGGVDNWMWYGDSIDDFCQQASIEMGHLDEFLYIEDLAEMELQNFKEAGKEKCQNIVDT